MPTIRKDIKTETNCIDKNKISRVISKYINNKMAKTYELEFLLTGISLRFSTVYCDPHSQRL